ncbi:MAG: CBS domain-containing protein [Nitriliruptor sp.]|nr:MAG: CBS domain-containing protein [Nitriliruptor sp.]
MTGRNERTTVASPRAHEVLGPEDFLRALAPFDQLDDEVFADAVASLEVIYIPAGTRILQRDGEPSAYLHVIRKGTALLSRDGIPALNAEAGEWFGLPSVLYETQPEFDVDALDDLLVYRLPAEVIRRLTGSPDFAAVVSRGLASRLRATSRVSDSDGAPVAVAMAAVSTLVRRPLVILPAEVDVGEIARTMRAERVSSVVLSTDPPAIVTTLDLRDRVLAEGHGPQIPGSSVASSPILSVDEGTSITEARVTMLERSMHHLGVERDGQLIGIVSTGDLLRADASSPFHVQRDLATASREAFASVPDQLHATIAGLLSGGLSPLEVTRTVSMLTDVLVRRAMSLAMEELGPAPCAYAWLTLGSDARREQTLLSDQDHALVHEATDDAGAAWFHAFATDITDLLAVAGLPRCPGGVMATNWSGTLETWRHRFLGWITAPDVQALYETSIFFDHRVIAGDLEVGELDEVVRHHRSDGVLLARLAAAAGTSRPPLGLFHRVRSTADGTVDLKAGGINPIVALGRLLAFEAGSSLRPTTDRLEVAVEHGGLARDAAEELTEAFRFFQQLRLEAHQRAWRQRTEPTNRIVLEELTPTRRRHLKEAFVAVGRIQQSTIQRLGGEEVSR